MSDASLRKALEEELFANPDDLATHAAYADLLTESGDPRGEFIQIQMALEDHDLSGPSRDELLMRYEVLWKTYRERWLGPLAPYLLEEDNATLGVRLGWLDSLEVQRLTLPLARALRDAPQARLLRHLALHDAHDESAVLPDDDVPEDETHRGFWPLVGSPCLKNVRVFRLGEEQEDDYEVFQCYLYTEAVAPLVRSMPNLEELYVFAKQYNLTDIFTLPTLKRLRILKAYHVDQVHRLDILAANPAFRRLTHLQFHPHHIAWHNYGDQDTADGFRSEEGFLPLRVVRALVESPNLPHLTHLQLRLSSMGDEGCQAILASGILKRLKSLDLRHGRITDVGAAALASCADAKNLTWLDLGSNSLTTAGVGAITDLGVPCGLDFQHDPADAGTMTGEEQYLTEGEFE